MNHCARLNPFLSTFIRNILSLLALILVSACAPSNSTVIADRILWPPAPASPLLEFKALYSSRNSVLSSRYQELPTMFEGSDEVLLRRASGVVSDGHGKVFVSDSVLRNVLIFDFVTKIVRVLDFDNLFGKPMGMDIGPDGRLYVADAGKMRVLVFGPDGKYLNSIGDKSRLLRPMNVAVNSSLGRIYVSDARKHQIVVFTLSGKFLFQFGGMGRGDGKLAMPHGLRFDKNGNLFVADMLNSRIQVFDPEGRFVSSIGDRAPYQLELEYPRDIAFSSDGILHIIDIKRALLVSCEPNGKLLLVTGSAGHTTHPLGLSSPTGISIGSDDTIHIVDQINNRLTLWKYFGTSSEQALHKEVDLLVK